MTKRKDGRLVRTVTDPHTGKRVYFYGATEREINRKMMEYSAKAEKGRTFEDVAKEWWEEAEPNLAMQSRRGYAKALERAISAFGEYLIKDIRPQDISLYLKDLFKKQYSYRTIANHRMICNLIFSYAIVSNDLSFNPCSNISVPKDAKKTVRKSASAKDEQIAKSCSHIWLFPFIAIYTGMRKGEILALNWRDIDFDNDFIYVTKSVAHDGDRPFIKQTKTEAGERIVPLLKPLKEELLKIEKREKDNFVISDDGKHPLTNRRYITLFSKFKDQTGMECTAHQLRHSFATIAFECGVPAKTVQEILGHKQLSTTMDIYTDFRKKALKEAQSLLES